MADELERTTLLTEQWPADRVGTIDRVVFSSGTVRFNVKVRDVSREKPFVDKLFRLQSQAEDFLYRKIMNREVRI